jgi:TrmH family RNA methyltransferase
MLERPDRLRVVLVGPRNPLNIGAAARAMSNFGFLHLRVVNPYHVAFREARSAMAAAPLLAKAEEFLSVADAVADCTLVVGTTALGHRELQHPLRRLELGARLVRRELAQDSKSARQPGGGRVALLFGAEKTGLSNDDLSHCHWLLRIPTREQHESMNLGQAVAVCLYELVRDAKAASKIREKTRLPGKAIDGDATGKRATAGEVERISTVLMESLELSGYIKPIAAAPTRERVRRMVRRMNLTSKDAELWLGMLRQMLWKIKAKENRGS